MNNKRATKRALLTSVMALVMCVVMLVGTTFAWFTDTASTGVNKIQAGNLDVALEMAVGKKDSGETIWENAEGKTLQFKKAAGAPADEQVLWEPGCTYELPELRVVNKGNLALKYIIKVTGIETNHEVVLGEPNLKDVIDWTIKYGTNKVEDNTGDIPVVTGYSLNPGASDVVTIKGEMDKNAGNEYQGLSIDGVSVTVYATQMTAEFDSFDNEYDKDAAYKGSQEFTSGTYTLNKGGVALATDARPVAVFATGSDTNVTITGGYYDGGSGGEYNIAVWANGGANVTIKDGTFTVGADKNGDANSVIYSTGGNIVIEGGFFYTNYNSNGFYYVLNQQNGNPGTITVKGGTFVNYDPSKGDDNLGGNFVPAGYSVISETKANGDKWFTVVKGTGATVGTQEALENAISGNNVATVKLTTSGTYTLPSLDSRDVTIIGTKDTVIDMKNKDNKASSASFEGVTVNFGTDNYVGFKHTGKLTYKDCTITGKQFLYANDVEFINCTFVQDAVDYNVWTYGAGSVLFKDCNFDCKGKAVLIYNEGTLAAQNVEFQNCKFKASAPVNGKAAIEIDCTYTSYNVVIDKATADNVTGFANGSVSGSTVWNVKLGSKPTTVTLNGTQVYPTV